MTDEERYRRALTEIFTEVSGKPWTVSGRKAWIRETCAEALGVRYVEELTEHYGKEQE